ncbi:MAG TPA: hypothetical protein ENN77_01035, partial [Candidatus Wirthbacteria bacterium]|nr:hypothetical protein [Candidatus Wirthbacteria bacterium]
MSVIVKDTKQTKINVIPFFVITLLVVLFARHWYKFCFNLVFIGYSYFEEMRMGIVFSAVVWRIALYPLRLLSHYFRRQEERVDAQHEKIMDIEDSVKRKLAQRQWLAKNQFILFFLWFKFCFDLMNALMVGLVFLDNFTPERVERTLYSFVSEPAFPLQTTNYIPLAGMVDLTKESPWLNFISALGLA